MLRPFGDLKPCLVEARKLRHLEQDG
jgi:hypothetical protein